MLCCYSGWMTGDDISNSASGGIAYALYKDCILNNGVAYGVSYNEDFSGVCWIRATTIDELEPIQGTKYVKASSKLINSSQSVFDSVKSDLLKGLKVVFIGLPCEVGVLRHLLTREKIPFDNLLLIDLICQGPLNQKLFQEYISLMENRFNSSIKNINMRFKAIDWRFPQMKIQFHNGQEYIEKLQNTELWSATVNMPMPSCQKCKFKAENHVSDITIGDNWAITERDRSFNKSGTSILFIHSKKGDIRIIAMNDLFLEKFDINLALKYNPRYSTSIEMTRDKVRYSNLYQKKGLTYAHEHRWSSKQKILRFISGVLKQ